MSFQDLQLPEAVMRALEAAGYTAPTDVQAQAIPLAMASTDLMVASRTGSGKTAAFLIPALVRVLAQRERAAAAGEPAPVVEEPQPEQRGRRGFGRRDDGNFRGGRRGRGGPQLTPSGPRVLVLAPTRELAQQVAKAASDLGRFVPGLRLATLVGGTPYGGQLAALRGPVDIAIGTPGRLLDHLEAGALKLGDLEMLVLDEADRMLDMGFIDDIRRVVEAAPEARQTVMFSATFDGQAGVLARDLLRAPQRIDVTSHTEAHADIEQRLHWADDLTHKNALLDHLLAERDLEQAVVFTSTQRDADWLADRLGEMGHQVAALHGGMPQGRRNKVLDLLRTRRLRVLVATDVAARGIDVPSISHVINYGLPMKEEDYVHRIGRTGRAGRTGLAVTLAERRDSGMIFRIQRYTTHRIPDATITGLEPKRPVPQMREPRGPREGFDNRGGFGRGRPHGGHGGGFGGRGFHDDRRGPGGFRGEGRAEQPETRHDPRFEQRPEPRFDGGHGAPRGDFRNDFRSAPRGDFPPRPQGDRPPKAFKSFKAWPGNNGGPDTAPREHAPHPGKKDFAPRADGKPFKPAGKTFAKGKAGGPGRPGGFGPRPTR